MHLTELLRFGVSIVLIRSFLIKDRHFIKISGNVKYRSIGKPGETLLVLLGFFTEFFFNCVNAALF